MTDQVYDLDIIKNLFENSNWILKLKIYQFPLCDLDLDTPTWSRYDQDVTTNMKFLSQLFQKL